jgi:hypothetical protein
MPEKQKSRFSETKPVMFCRLYPHHYADVAARVRVGRTWGGKGIRKRVRALARKETRLHLRQLRATAITVKAEE